MLSKSQGTTLRIIAEMLAAMDWAPSVRELSERRGLNLSSTHAHLVELQRLGLVTRGGPGQARSLHITEAGEQWLTNTNHSSGAPSATN